MNCIVDQAKSQNIKSPDNDFKNVDDGYKEKRGVEMKKYAVVLLVFEVLISQSLKTQDDKVDSAAMVKENQDKAQYPI